MSVELCTQVYGEEYWRIKDKDGREWSVDHQLATNCLSLKYYAKIYNADIVIFIDGKEGSGKSKLARQLAKLLDNEFNEKKIFYNFEALKNFYYNGQKWEAGVYDESDEGVDRREGPKKINIEFAKFMRQSRQANKILIMCGPSIYDIASYVAQHRVNFLIHCYKRDNIHPGHFMFFNETKIHKLFTYDKTERVYRQTPNFIGTFSSADIVDMEAYDLRKKHAFFKFKNGASAADARTPQEIVAAFIKSRIVEFDEAQKKCKGLTVKDFCAAFGIERKTFYKYADAVEAIIKEKEDEPIDSPPPPKMGIRLLKRQLAHQDTISPEDSEEKPDMY
jgi:hypothetical protein